MTQCAHAGLPWTVTALALYSSVKQYYSKLIMSDGPLRLKNSAQAADIFRGTSPTSALLRIRQPQRKDPQCLSFFARSSILPPWLGSSKTWYRCQVKIGTPQNRHPGCPISRKNRHPDAYIHVNIGIRVPIFTVNMGIPL